MDNIIVKLDELIQFIKDSDDYKKYLVLKEKLNNDTEIMIIINDIKLLQKKAVKEQAEKKDTKDIDIEIDKKLKVLNNSILYQEYIDIQEKLDEEFQNIKYILDKYFYDKIN